MPAAVLLCSAAARCPPLSAAGASALLQCSLRGQAVDCGAAAGHEPGTRFSLRCRPLHRFLYDYVPPAGLDALCIRDGVWTQPPYPCVPGQRARPLLPRDNTRVLEFSI